MGPASRCRSVYVRRGKGACRPSKTSFRRASEPSGSPSSGGARPTPSRRSGRPRASPDGAHRDGAQSIRGGALREVRLRRAGDEAGFHARRRQLRGRVLHGQVARLMLDSYDGDARKRERQDSVMPPQNIDGLIRIGMDEFTTSEIQTGETSIFVRSQGSGPPILLLHGFPQTHLMWRGVAPLLAHTFAVVCADLRGYGLSGCPASARNHAPYAKRSMAQDMVTVMERLGFWRFSVAGHDRGGRVAYRIALDHPDRVGRLAVLNIVPTADQFERMAGDASIDYYPWFFLAQPPPFPERLVGASAEYFLRHTLDSFAATPAAIAPEAAERYRRAFTADVIAAICADYRAAFHIDRPMDADDRAAGRKIRCAVLAHWGAEEGSLSDGPLLVWRQWADAVEGGPLPSGHFIAEEAPEELLVSLRSFLR